MQEVRKVSIWINSFRSDKRYKSQLKIINTLNSNYELSFFCNCIFGAVFN